MQDRIRQMAEEAGLRIEDEGFVLAGPLDRPSPEWPAMIRFARLVAEDCARWVDGNAAQCSGMTAELMHSNADAIRARYAEMKEP